MSFYHSREEKPRWITEQFRSLFSERTSVLDVGCDKRQFAEQLPEEVSYTGIDMNPEADIRGDLDAGEQLPFKDGEFEVVVSLDTLEHLEHIHFMFDELLRVADSHVIISLPNPVFGALSSYIRGTRYAKTEEEQKEFGLYTKQYGIPLEPPPDRHRWFFSTEEAERFIEYRARNRGWRIRETVYSFDRKPLGPKKVLALALSGFRRRKALNLFNWTTVFVLEKDT